MPNRAADRNSPIRKGGFVVGDACTLAQNGRGRADGRMVHDMYLVQVKSPEESKYTWDYYKVVQTVPGKDSFTPLSESKCGLVK